MRIKRSSSHYRSFQNKPCVNFDIKFTRRVIPKNNYNVTRLVNEKNVTLFHLHPIFFFKFKSDEIKLTTQYQAYPLKSFLAEIGGYVGMFLGISFMQVGRYLSEVFSYLFFVDYIPRFLKYSMQFVSIQGF